MSGRSHNESFWPSTGGNNNGDDNDEGQRGNSSDTDREIEEAVAWRHLSGSEDQETPLETTALMRRPAAAAASSTAVGDDAVMAPLTPVPAETSTTPVPPETDTLTVFRRPAAKMKAAAKKAAAKKAAAKKAAAKPVPKPKSGPGCSAYANNKFSFLYFKNFHLLPCHCQHPIV